MIINKINPKSVQAISEEIEKVKNLEQKNRIIELTLINTDGDISLLSDLLKLLKTNKVKLEVKAQGVISGAGIIILAAGRRGKRVLSAGTTLSFKNFQSDSNTSLLIRILESNYKINAEKLKESLDSKGILGIHKAMQLNLIDKFEFAGKIIKKDSKPKQVKDEISEPVKQTNPSAGKKNNTANG